MRRTFIFGLLLMAASVGLAAGSSPGRARAHRKVVAHSPHAARSQASLQTGTRKTVRRLGPRRASAARLRRAEYTPELTRRRGGSSYAAGYANGYEAGRAAALGELADESADRTSSGPKGEHGTERSLASGAPTDLASPEDSTLASPEASTAGREAGLRQNEHANDKLDAGDKNGTEAAFGVSATPWMAELNPSDAGVPASLKGSLASLERQNSILDAEGLERIEDENDLSSRIEHKLLVPLPASAALTVNPSLPDHHRYCRPWTARFLVDLARAHEAAFHKPIEVNSAVRTVEYQKQLMTRNGNAAPAEGDVVSPHLTGATVDIAKEGLSRQEMDWMRRQLLALEEEGKIDVEEEFEQACFHITVYKTYAPYRPERKTEQTVTSPSAGPRHKAVRPASKAPSQLPADLAAGVLPAQGR